jgi:hypothetical protein
VVLDLENGTASDKSLSVSLIDLIVKLASDHRKHIAHIKLADRIEAAHQAFAAGSPDAISYLSEIPELIAKADQTQRSLAASPYVWTEPEALPAREWLYGHHLIRKFASATIAAGGVGKSSLSIAEAVALAASKPLLGVRTALPRRVWLWNLEDPADEIARRIQAVCLHYGIRRSDIEGRLFVSSGRNDPCVIARSDRVGTFIVQPLVDRIVAEIKAKRIDVLVIDPFVACHAVAENDNGAIEAVAKERARVADRANCAVELVHHSRKTGGTEVTADDARGASALVNACRSVRALNRMTDQEAAKAGVENHRRYFRVLTDKLNLAPPPAASDWFMLESISLGNGPPSDHVGVVVPWQWPDAFDGIAPGTLFAVQQRISQGSWKVSPQAQNWAGVAVAEVLGLDPADAKDKSGCRTLLKTWIDGGALQIVRRQDESRHERPFIEVGQWTA